MEEHWKNFVVAFTGFVIFAVLNVLMLQTNFGPWTEANVDFYNAFHNGWEFSGFDNFAYITVSKWQPMYEIFRHPLLTAFLWPLSVVNEWLVGLTGMNCTIFIFAVLWTLLSTCSWVLLHRLINRVVGLGTWVSLLLCAYYFSFAYVMLVTFVADHMMLTMTLLLLTLWWACKAGQSGKPLPLWKAMLMFLVSTGVTTTNSVKVWITDMMSHWKVKESKSQQIEESVKAMFRRSLWYIIPLVLVYGGYKVQKLTTEKWAHEKVMQITSERKANDKNFEENTQKHWGKKIEYQQHNRIIDNPVFDFTNTSVDRVPTIIHNAFGEGLILHEEHTLEDIMEARPLFVEYGNKWYYAIEAIIVILFAAGIWVSHRERLMWMLLGIFAFDAFLHIGLRFAACEVYIMTAHWAFIIPIATAYLLRAVKHRCIAFCGLTACIALLTTFLWLHNGALIVNHILG